MKKLKVIEGKRDRYLEFTDDNGHKVKFEKMWDSDSKINLVTLEYCTIADKEYKNSVWLTLAQLLNAGVVKEGSDLEECSFETDVCLEHYKGNLDIDAVLAYFKAHGYNVDRDAVTHNLRAWQDDMKSGYRGKDYFLFTPCGCNRLRFDAMRLIAGCDWQYTYEA
ncbi:MAG: hypothetical protein E7108_01790 [Bacteroidales bacterium]|nr:hypothetical protein [Bacteroidales bacterium]